MDTLRIHGHAVPPARGAYRNNANVRNVEI